MKVFKESGLYTAARGYCVIIVKEGFDSNGHATVTGDDGITRYNCKNNYGQVVGEVGYSPRNLLLPKRAKVKLWIKSLFKG